MARRRESLLETLVFLPWWVGVLFGIAGYGAVAHILPMFWRDHLLGTFAQGVRPIAARRVPRLEARSASRTSRRPSTRPGTRIRACRSDRD